MSPSSPQPSPPPRSGFNVEAAVASKHFVQYVEFGSVDEPITLESGQSIGPIRVAFETFGTPNADCSNAILVTHALTGDSHVGRHVENDTPGWWEGIVGPGKALDTDKYWIVCSNVLGGCQGTTGPANLNPKTREPYGLDFPIVTIRDMVDVQYLLKNHLGVEQWHSVIGGSLGGFQTMEWALRYPDSVKSIVLIASAARLSAQGIAFNAVGRHAITRDPLWHGGRYKPGEGPAHGLATARQMAHITYLSEQILDEKFGRRLQSADRFSYDFSSEFAVESYLAYQGDKFIQRFDANSYLYLTKAMDYYDVESQYGPLNLAAEKISAKTLLISYTSDWLFPTECSRVIAKALRANDKDVSFVELDSGLGHDAFLVETDPLNRILVPFLGSVNLPDAVSPRQAVGAVAGNDPGGNS